MTGSPAWAVGDVAVIDPKIPCGSCEDCRAGAGYRCAMALTAGIGFARDGGFAERVAVPAATLHRLPPGLALEHACLVEPLSVAIHGVERARAPLRATPLSSSGLGPIGLLTVATLHARGVGPIIGVDPVADRRQLALDLGASDSGGRDPRGAQSSSAPARAPSSNARATRRCSTPPRTWSPPAAASCSSACRSGRATVDRRSCG